MVSPVHPVDDQAAWGDEVTAGNVFGPVLVSPTLCDRLDALAERTGVQAGWLTSWSKEMRDAIQPFPGRSWPTIADEATWYASGPRWWKLTALEAWLDEHPDVTAVCWLDDRLKNPARAASVRRRLASRRVDGLVAAPDIQAGLTPEDLTRIEEWVGARFPDPA
ncbi:MAG: hypothetical protein JWN22_1321 [Nocardioides sp.]|nr:hypothetical protein [Nocardioides sp.]